MLFNNTAASDSTEGSGHPGSKNASSFFSTEAARMIKETIDNAYGNEVLFFSWINEQREVERVKVIARGNEESVAVPLEKSYLPDVIIHNHPDGNLIPSEQDVRISSLIANRGVGFYIINNSLTEVYVVIEPVEKTATVPLDSDALMALVSNNGPLSSAIPHFEEREGQRQMVAYVCDAFNGNELALIEAGTGIGKSLAYLIPSVYWSLSNDEKVIISTKTINLQEQLLYKDIPDLKRTLDSDFSYTLMKGRGNYICLNRLYEAQQDLFALIDDEEIDQFNAIVDWLRTSEEASLTDLPFLPHSSLWEKINSQAGPCLGGKCAYFSTCPVNRARRNAARAHIIVTNHHYLLADAQLADSDASLLPPYKRVIFDEAHNLEESATSFFTKSVTLSRTLRLLNLLYTGSRKNKGYLVYLSRKGIFLKKGIIQNLMRSVTHLRSSAFDLFDAFEELFSSMTRAPNDPSYSVIELSDEMKSHPLWEGSVLKKIDVFYKGCSAIAGELLEVKEKLDADREERTRRQINGFISQCLDFVETLDKFLDENDPAYVRWIQKKKEVEITVSMLEVGSILYDQIFSRMKTCVLTSATLTVGDSFRFIKSRLALRDPGIETRLTSPFNYENQMKILIPDDIPQPDHPDYSRDISGAVLGILKKTEGKAFILFTSYKTLNEVYENIRGKLQDDGFVLLKQGSESRRSLLETFKTNIHSILFGTESFWEGVDAPGKTLECVIITKLPFKVPTEPIVRARLDKIRENGGNPFVDYYVPLAVIKMKQGIGRLIRNKKDRGVIVILDKRILVKNYGGLFLNSMPTKNVYHGHLSGVMEEAERFLAITP